MSRMASASFEIGRRSETCAATGTPIVAGERIVTALIEREDGTLERRDYREPAWAEQGERPAGLFAFWYGVASPPGAPRSPLIDSESIMGIFEQLEEANEPRRLAFRYLLALVLVRRRLLVMVDSRPALGGEPGLMRVRRRVDGPEGEVLEVVDPGLDQATISDATEQLQAILRIDA